MQIDDILARPFATISDMVRAFAQELPTHAALWLDERRIDYATLDGWMDRVAAALQRDGLQPREAIAICASTSIEYALVFLGAIRAGLVVAPLAPDTRPVGLAAMVRDADARLLFLDQVVAEHLAPALDSMDVPRVTLDEGASGRPLSNWLAAPDTTPQPVNIEADWAFNIIYSSGTTGTPKGIVVPHSFRWASVQLFRALGYGTDTVTLVSIPLYSNMTLSSFLPALSLGSPVVLMRKFDAGNYLTLAERHRVTHSMMVPVQFQRLMAHPDFDRFDLSSFRMKSCGSAPFAAGLKADVLQRWPGKLVEYYGMTEGGGICVLPASDRPDKLHTVGLPAPGHDIRIIDDDGCELPRGAIGEIVGRSPTMMTGYHKLPHKTAEVEWFDAQGQRFIRSGDNGRFDDDGFLVLMDRKKDMIISGGFNVYPSDLEAVLIAHDDVAEAAVFGVPSERWGETPVASVVLRPGADTTAAALMDWAHAQLGKTQRLSELHIVESLPRSDIGKVLKRQLRDAHAQARRDPSATGRPTSTTHTTRTSS